MQEDQDVGNIHPEALFVVCTSSTAPHAPSALIHTQAKITEQFLAQLVQDSAADCAEEGTKVIRPMNLCAHTSHDLGA